MISYISFHEYIGNILLTNVINGRTWSIPLSLISSYVFRSGTPSSQGGSTRKYLKHTRLGGNAWLSFVTDNNDNARRQNENYREEKRVARTCMSFHDR